MVHLKLELQEILLAKEEQEDVLKRRERELTALKGALKEEVAAHDHEVDKMKEQYEKEMSRLQTSLEEAKQVVRLLCVLPLLASSLSSLLLVSSALPLPPSRNTPCDRAAEISSTSRELQLCVCVLLCELQHMFFIRCLKCCFEVYLQLYHKFHVCSVDYYYYNSDITSISQHSSNHYCSGGIISLIVKLNHIYRSPLTDRL